MKAQELQEAAYKSKNLKINFFESLHFIILTRITIPYYILLQVSSLKANTKGMKMEIWLSEMRNMKLRYTSETYMMTY